MKFFQGLMGEANLRFVRGETDTAIRMCMEVIRQDPAVAEPFQTLATLYDGLGKFVQPKKPNYRNLVL